MMQATRLTPYINQKHFEEWTAKSAVSETIAQLNCETLDDTAEIARRLGWRAYQHTSGWWVSGIDLETGKRSQFGQWKPDQKIVFPDGNEAKYLSSKSGYDAIALDTGISGYWANVLTDVSIPILITEGAKKAGAGLTLSLPTLALIGVDMGLLPKSNKLVPTLDQLAQPGRHFKLAFDSDIVEKKEVRSALKRLAGVLQRRSCKVDVVLWNSTDGKGMDDFIIKRGADDFKERVERSTPYSEWLKGAEKQFKGDDKKSSKMPKQAAIASELTGFYRPKLAWHTGIKLWYHYSHDIEGIWSETTPEAVKMLIIAALDANPETNGKYSNGYVNGIMGLLEAHLAVNRWDETTGKLPLLDGVLNTATQKLEAHSPGNRFRWCLPYRWVDRKLGHEPIQQWLMETTGGDSNVAELLRAYLKAVVTGRADLQRYLELLGPGGTGKSTFMNLAQALIGTENTSVTTLRQLEENRFESSAIFGKRLTLITDSERYGGEVSVFKALTGQDPVRHERKNVQQIKPFIYEGMVILAANEAPKSSDYTSGLERRRLTVPFFKQVKAGERRDLITEFKPYLAGVLAWVLAMPDDRVSKLVRDTQINSLRKWRAEQLIATNPLAEWMDYCLALSPSNRTQVGVAKRDKDSNSLNSFQNVSTWLYASYCEYSAASGNRAVSSRRFSDLLQDLCVNQLKLPGITKGRDRYGSYFEGLSIRSDGDDSPRIITGAVMDCDGSNGVCDGSVTAETLAGDECDGCDGFLPSQHNLVDFEEKNKCSGVEYVENEIFDSNPSQPITIEPQQAIQPSQPSITTHHNPSQPLTLKQLQIGDRVAHSDPYVVAHSYHGEIVDMAEDEVQVRWDERKGKPNEYEFYKVSEIKLLSNQNE